MDKKEDFSIDGVIELCKQNGMYLNEQNKDENKIKFSLTSNIQLEEAKDFADECIDNGLIRQEAHKAILQIKEAPEPLTNDDNNNYGNLIVFEKVNNNNKDGYKVIIGNGCNNDNIDAIGIGYDEYYAAPDMYLQSDVNTNVIIQKYFIMSDNGNWRRSICPCKPYIEIDAEGNIFRKDQFGTIKKTSDGLFYLYEDNKYSLMNSEQIAKHVGKIINEAIKDNELSEEDHNKLLKELSFNDIFDKQIEFDKDTKKFYITEMTDKNNYLQKTSKDSHYDCKGIYYSFSPFNKFEGQLFRYQPLQGRLSNDDYIFEGTFDNVPKSGKLFIKKTKKEYKIDENDSIGLFINDETTLEEAKHLFNSLNAIRLVSDKQYEILLKLFDKENIQGRNIYLNNEKIFIDKTNDAKKTTIAYGKEGQKFQLLYENGICKEEIQYDVDNNIIAKFTKNENDTFSGFTILKDCEQNGVSTIKQGIFKGNLPIFNHILHPIGKAIIVKKSNKDGKVITTIKGNKFEVNSQSQSVCDVASIIYHNDKYEQKYEGPILNYYSHGEGILTFKNKDSYKGNFSYDKIDSKGVYTSNKTKTKYDIEYNNNINTSKWTINIKPIIINKKEKIEDIENIFNFLSNRVRNDDEHIFAKRKRDILNKLQLNRKYSLKITSDGDICPTEDKSNINNYCVLSPMNIMQRRVNYSTKVSDKRRTMIAKRKLKKNKKEETKLYNKQSDRFGKQCGGYKKVDYNLFK